MKRRAPAARIVFLSLLPAACGAVGYAGAANAHAAPDQVCIFVPLPDRIDTRIDAPEVA